MADKMYDQPIDRNIPWDGNEKTGNLPVRGTRVEEFLKNELNSKVGIFYYDQQSNKQLVFANEDTRDLYLENPVDNAHLLLGAFDAPANYTAEISLMSSPAVSVLKEQKGNYIEFTFDIKNKSGASVGDSVICTYTFISSGKKVEVREVYTAGQSVRFLVDDYLVEGVNTVNISIVGRTTMAATMVGVTYNVVDLTITTDFDFATAKQPTDTLEIPYVVKGTGVKYMEFYVDGVKYGEDDTITDAVGIRTKYIDIANLSSGRHHLQMRAYVISSGQKFYSHVVYRDFAIAGDGIVSVLIATTLADLVGDRLTLKGSQYSSISFDFALYDSRQRILGVVFAANGTEVSTISTSNGTVNTFSYALDTVGETIITATCEDTTYEVSVEVTKSDIDIEEPTEGLVMKLSAKGRSNSENKRWSWTDRGYIATLNNFAYTEKQGWHNDALVISGGATVDVDIAPLASNWATTGGTIVFDIETADVEDAEAVLCECVDDNTSAGFIVKPNETSMQSSGGAKVKTNYRERERHQIAIIVNKTSGVENAKTILIVNDGKCERAINFSDTDSFVCPKNLSIGDPNGKVTLKVYSIQVFNRALTVDEAFNSWALDSSDTQAIVQRNDIYVEGTKFVSPDKIVSRVPVMIITGDMPKIIAARDKKTSIYADVEYINNQDPTKNFTASMMKFYRQGTSSLGYDIPNLNGEADENSTMYDYEGKKMEAYSFKDKAQPVRLWCWKADYAESSGAHNTGIARLWNKVMYNTKLDSKYLNEGEDPYVLRTNAQRAAIQANYPYDVRTTIDGFPIVLFYRLDKNSELVCMGQYNFNNDKKTESVFGFVDIPGFDNSNVECWEGLNNTHPIGLYTDVSKFDSDWQAAFEARYPDGSTKVDNLKKLATWINSTKGNVEKFSTEKYEHLDVWKVAAYYIYLMRFGAVDQPVKNSMTTTEDGKRYFFINYDNDTIDGKRNDGPLVYGPFITRQSIDEELNDYAYAGHESVLWNNLEADADFMEKVRIIDNAMYEAGLSYDGVIEEFDTNQVDKWCEKLCNLNGDYKYLKPFREKGNNYLKLLQGDLKSHRHWWLSNRFEMFNAMWVSGTYKSKFIEFKAAGAHGPSEGILPQGFTIMAGKDLQYGYGINNDPIQYNKKLAIGESHRFTFRRDLAVGDPVRIYAANSIRELHLEEIADTLVQLNVESAFDELLGTRLKAIYLNASDSNLENNAVSDISGLPLVTALETLIIRGFKAIKSLDLSTLENLRVFNATNSGLTSFVPATGVNLVSVALPSGIQAIRLDKANVHILLYVPGTTLREVVMKNVTGIDVKSFVLRWRNSLSSAETDLLSTASLTLEGINWTGMTAADVLKLADFGYHSLKGKITLTSLNQEEMDLLTETFGSNVFQSTGEFIIDAPASVFLTGPTTVLSGETAYYKAVAFPVTEGTEFKYQIVGVSSTTDSEGNIIYKSGTTILYESTGKLVTVESTSTSSFTLRARLSGSSIYLDSNISISGRTYPSSVTLEGDNMIKTTGEKSISATYNVQNFTGSIKSVSWSLDCEASLAEVGENNSLGCKIIVNDIPDNYIETILTLNVSFGNGTSLSKTIKLMIGKSLPIMTSETNPEVMNAMYKAGLAANKDFMTESEAAAVLSSDLNSSTSSSTSIFYKYASTMKKFDEFKYFTGVTEIVDSVFNGRTGLTSITIPNSVTSIGTAAFYNCRSLTSITIPDSVTSIGEVAFGSCMGLTSVTIPDSVTVIDSRTFEACSGLTSITISKNLSRIGDSAFNGCSSLTSVTIPDSVTKIESSTFYGCTSLTSITIPNSVTSIGGSAFNGCSSLTSITIPNSVTSIGDKTFYGCTSLTSITIPNSVTSIYSSTFVGCDNLTSIVVDQSNEIYDSRDNCNAIITKNNNQLVVGCKSTIIPNSVTSIGGSAFSSCRGLTSITIPNSVTSIGDKTFYGCISLTSITIPNSVTSIGGYAFNGCSSLTSITIPNSVTSIYSNTFYDCTSLTSITIPNSVTGIYSSAFYNCRSLTSITIPDSVTVIDSRTFEACSGLTSITISKNLSRIGDSAFYNCKALKNITIRCMVAPTVGVDVFGYSTSTYTGRNTYNTGENILYIPQGATGYDTSYWLDPLQNSEKCGFSIEYLPVTDLEIGSWITIDQTITDPATMITGDVNGEHIQLIRNNSHRYLGKYTAEGTMTLCQLDDNDSTKYSDGTTADLTGAEGDVFMKMPRFWYRAKEMSTDVWGIGFYYGTESPGENWKEWNGNELIGVYEAYSKSEKLYSRSGVISSGDISQENFKAYARNRGNGFQIVDWQMHCVMAILFYAQYGHTNCQEKIGAGTSSIEKRCGQTNANGMNDTKGASPVSGLNDAGADGNTQSINFWGLENWWGNKYEWIDNVVVDAYEWKITEPDGTVRTPGKAGTSTNYITKMMFGDNCDLIPTAARGSETTGFCDYYYGSSSTARVVQRSVSYSSPNGGVAYVYTLYDSSYVHPSNCSRLAFRGQCVEAESVATFKSLTAIG